MALINYDIDFKKMVQQLVGYILRKVIRVAWLTACLKVVRNIHDDVVASVTMWLYDVKWNGQTIKLQELLIDKFGEGIYIVNNILEKNGAFVGEGLDNGFYVGENNDNSQHIDVTYSIEGKSFTVYVPVALVFTMSEMVALINKYKMFGTTYEIVTF